MADIMTNIIIKPENAAKINAALKQANGKARVRTIDDYYEVNLIIGRIEIELRAAGITTKKLMENVRFCFDQMQHFPNRYRGRPEATYIICHYHNGFWRLDRAGRDYCNSTRKANRGYTITLTDAAKQAVVEKVERG